MKLKNIKAFEDFHSVEENEREKMFAHEKDMYASEEENEKDEYSKEEEEEDEDNSHEYEERAWGDEAKLERFATFNEKKKENKKGEKPDFPDVDGDGDRKEPISKAAKDAKKDDKKDDKKFVKPKKGEVPAALAAYQKKKKK